MTKSPGDNPFTRASHVPWVSLCLLASITAAAFWPGAVPTLVYDKAAVAAGEWWRLLTAHVVHFSNGHLLRNAFLLLPAAFWLELRSRTAAVLVLSLAPALSAAIFLAAPSIVVFAGSSGIAYGMIVALATNRWWEVPHRRRWWATVLVFAVAKCAGDLLGAFPSDSMDPTGTGIVHSLGALTGGIAGATGLLLGRLRK